MNKAFTREVDREDEEDDDVAAPVLPQGAKNYITVAGYQRLRQELMTLLDDERPKVVEAVSWAAKNGDRSENGDYLYGKKRLREIDRRIRFLTKRLDIAEVVDPSAAPRQRAGLLRRDGPLRERPRRGADDPHHRRRRGRERAGRGELDRADRAGAAEGARRRRGAPDDAARGRGARGARGALSGAGARAPAGGARVKA